MSRRSRYRAQINHVQLVSFMKVREAYKIENLYVHLPWHNASRHPFTPTRYISPISNVGSSVAPLSPPGHPVVFSVYENRRDPLIPSPAVPKASDVSST